MLAHGAGARAQIAEEDLRLPISLDAESTDYDGRSSMLMFRNLRLTQGNIGVQADEGRATKLDFEDSVWRFTGNVVIDTENGHIECEAADLRFTEHQLSNARISGSPATFELQRPQSDESTYAEAGEVDYDFSKGIVRFSGNATITEGGNQISSNYLVYNIAEQRINAQSAEDGSDRVKITYTPRPADEAALQDSADALDAGDVVEPTDDDGGDANR
jgi:lipopolysaccharide transport protein LptA